MKKNMVLRDIIGEYFWKGESPMPTREEFIQLAQRHMDTVFRLAFSCLKSQSDADDVTQTVLLRLYETKKVFDSDAHVKYWLIRVTLNECKKIWRSPWRKVEELTGIPQQETLDRSVYSDLLEAIMALDRKYRTVIFLYYYEGYTVAQTAKLLGLPQSTVGTQLKRAKERLKQYLTQEEP